MIKSQEGLWPGAGALTLPRVSPGSQLGGEGSGFYLPQEALALVRGP